MRGLHELSVMSQVVESIMGIVREKRSEKVHSVRLQVGDLTFLVWDQLEFAWEVFTRNEGPPITGAELILERLEARGLCPSCSYAGPLKVVDFPDSHFTTPTLDCPECGTVVEVTDGRDLLIREIKMDVPSEMDDEVEGEEYA